MYALRNFLLVLLVTAGSALAETQVPFVQQSAKSGKRLSFQEVLSGSLRPQRSTLQWTSSGRDGSYFETNATTGDLWLAHILDEDRELLVNGTSLQATLRQSNAGKNVTIKDYKLQPGGRNVLVTSNYTKLYRWSGFADVDIYDPTSGTIERLNDDQAGDVRYATWSPRGDSVAYVRNNDLYVYRDGKRTRVTSDGSADVFNAVPDWIYEEEIFSTTNTLWYSPDGRFIAFLRFNETEVPTYRVPYYMNGQTATSYPTELELRYPKAGQPIPFVSLHLVDTQNLDRTPQRIESDAFTPENLIIGEVMWPTDGHSHLAWRCFNRVQDQDKLIVMEISTGRTFVASERHEENGWIDNLKSVRHVPRMNCYVYISDEDGWKHIYLQYINGTGSLQVTKGEWEVTEILYVNSTTVIYQSTEQHSTERHIYSLDLEFLKKTPLVSLETPGNYEASFSSNGKYYVLSSQGPGIPTQAVYSTENPSKPIRTLQDNNELASQLREYNLPSYNWTTLKHPEGFELNVLEALPPNFQPNKKYPVLLNPYGGPDSQQTTKNFHGADWWAFIASEPSLEYVILTVDGRGTGFKGKTFRSAVTGNLGYYEAQDQIFAAESWCKKSYVDCSKIVIQGWSYGGYLSSKVIEMNSDVISSAIITAPVSSWLFYDAFYTERYMKHPLNNTKGYYTSSVHNTTGFSSARGGVLLQHGTGDDNVHFQHSAVLVDLLMTGGVASEEAVSMNGAMSLNSDHGIDRISQAEYLPQPRDETAVFLHDEASTYQPREETKSDNDAATRPVSPSKLTVQWFTDSDHGISFHGSTLFLRKQMARWLYREKRRKEISPDEDQKEEAWLRDL